MESLSGTKSVNHTHEVVKQRDAMAEHEHQPQHAASDGAPHPWGPPMRIGKVFIKGNKRTRYARARRVIDAADTCGHVRLCTCG